MTTKLQSHVSRFAGLSDRSVPVQLTRIENPDLLNVEFSGRVMERRNGYRRVHTTMLRDSAVNLDGVNDYLLFEDRSAFDWSNRGFVSIDCRLQALPPAEGFLLSRGSGTGSSRFFLLSYDPTINTNAGGWRCSVFDTGTASALATATINDGSEALGEYRHIELVHSTGNDYTFRVRDEDGATIGADQTLTIETWIASADDWRIGSDTGTTLFLNCDVGEFRLGDHTAAPAAAGIIGRELDRSAETTELANLIGYWRLADGKGSTFANEIAAGNGRSGIAANEAPQWVTDSSLTVGPSGLEFFGHSGGIHWHTTFSAYLFDTATTGGFLWEIDLHFVPRLDPGESIASGGSGVRNQTLLWTGVSATVPVPLGIEVISDKVVVKFRDNATAVTTLTIPTLLSTLVDTRCAVGVYYQRTSAGVDTIVAILYKQSPTQDRYIPAGGPVTDSTFTAGSMVGFISTEWSVGHKLATIPAATGAGGAVTFQAGEPFARCIISTVRCWKKLGQNGAVGAWHSYANNQEVTQSPTGATTLVAQLRMNDGVGRSLTVEGARISGTTNSYADLYPEHDDGLSFAEGLVEPYESPVTHFVSDYRSIKQDGGTARVMAVVSGTTLYGVDTGTGLLSILAGNLPKGGPWTSVQYANRIYLASANGRRPKELTATGVVNVGVEAPAFVPPIVKSDAGGALVNGAYHFYVTFRNDDSGQESNPSLASTITIGGGPDTGQITSVGLPISADPQVTQRLVYMTAVGGGAGSAAFLAGTVEDNTSTAFTTAITAAIPVTNAQLEYFTNEEAPIGSVVQVFKDRLFVAGNPSFPTRVWWSEPGTLSSYDQSVNFVDADLDEGDPVVALKPLGDLLIAYLRDGKQAISPSQVIAAPFFITRISDDRGAVAHRAIQLLGSSHIVFGERDVYVFNGVNSISISSPQGDDSPSIESTIRNDVEPSRREKISIAHYRNRNQVWMTYSSRGSTRNDKVLVYDRAQGIWSLYGMDLDFVAEVEDSSDDPLLFGASNGFVVHLDQGDFDGHALAAAGAGGAVTGGTTFTLTDTGQSWTTNQFKGNRVYWFDASSVSVESAIIRKNTATTLSFYTAATSAPAVLDGYIIGGIPWFADWLFDFGSALTLKKIISARFAGESDNNSNVLKLSIEKDQISRAWSGTGAKHNEIVWPTTDAYKLAVVGGVGRSFRVRLSDTGFPGALTTDAIPSVTGRMAIHEFMIEAEGIDAK